APGTVLAGLSEFPGGKCESDETPQACQNRSGGPQPDKKAAGRFNNRDTDTFHDGLLGVLRTQVL
ncbi:MAG: hypothetical protein ACK48Y_08565, partial [Planctomyces sp.]